LIYIYPLDNRRSDDGSKLERAARAKKVRVDTFKIQDAAVNKAAEEKKDEGDTAEAEAAEKLRKNPVAAAEELRSEEVRQSPHVFLDFHTTGN
jgi:hypothetical protein